MRVDYQFDLGPGCEAGITRRIAPGVRRLIADNPSPMTFTGTATYLLGRGSVAVIDPGPGQPIHIDRILDALQEGERIEAVFVTHRHLDHSSGAQLLRSRIDAPVYAIQPQVSPCEPPPAELLAAHPGGGEGIDLDFVPDRVLDDGDLVQSIDRAGGSPAWSLRAIFTPGHLDDHACFASERDGFLFTGDHVMGWSSTMVSPPEGDNGVYKASLLRLAGRAADGQDRRYYPGHGHPVGNPAALLDHLIRRRRQRDKQILAALAEGPRNLEALVRRGYRGLNGMQAHAARRMMLAHLIHLERRDRICFEPADDGILQFMLRESRTPGRYHRSTGC